MVDETLVANRGEAFSNRVLTLFVTSIVTAGLGILIGFVLARVLGPSGKGAFYLITLLPVTLMVLTQVGLPDAFGFFSARSQTKGANLKTLILTAALAGPALVISIALLPVLQATILGSIDPFEIVLGLAALPFLLNATFTTGLILGRQAVGWFAFVSIGQSVGAIVLFVTFVGFLGYGVTGALWAFLLLNLLSAVGFLIGSIRVGAKVPQPKPVSYRELFRFGLPLYPGSITQHFSVRIDVYLIAAMVADPAAPLGYYSMSVTMAQLVFFLPTAVSALFFPHVAGSDRQDADRQVPVLARVTLLLTLAMAILLVPVSILTITFILPAFEPSLVPLFVILPGVVALSLTQVLSSYVTGVGLTAWTSVIRIGALVVNVVANLILIPRFGIVGAAVASLISYTGSAIAFSILAARCTHGSVADFWLVRPSDVRFATEVIIGTGRRVLRRSATLP